MLGSQWMLKKWISELHGEFFFLLYAMRFGCHVVTEKLIQDVKSNLVGILNLIKTQCFIGSPVSIVFSRTFLFFFFKSSLCLPFLFVGRFFYLDSSSMSSSTIYWGTKVKVGKSLLNSSVLFRIFLSCVCVTYILYTHTYRHTHMFQV